MQGMYTTSSPAWGGESGGEWGGWRRMKRMEGDGESAGGKKKVERMRTQIRAHMPSWTPQPAGAKRRRGTGKSRACDGRRGREWRGRAAAQRRGAGAPLGLSTDLGHVDAWLLAVHLRAQASWDEIT